jgi:hypothetical protein
VPERIVSKDDSRKTKKNNRRTSHLIWEPPRRTPCTERNGQIKRRLVERRCAPAAFGFVRVLHDDFGVAPVLRGFGERRLVPIRAFLLFASFGCLGEEHGARAVVDAEADEILCPLHRVGVEPIGEGGTSGGGDDAVEGGDEGRKGAEREGGGDVVGAEGRVEGGGGVASCGEEGHEAGDGEGAVWGGCGEEEDLWVEPVAEDGLVSRGRGGW